MKILITGGSGFIGTNLIEYYLSTGVDVLNIDIKCPKIKDHEKYWENIDIRNYKEFKSAIEKYSPDFVLHMAARANLTGKTIDEYSSNTIGVENLIKIANDITSIRKIIFTSTMLVCRAGYMPKNENDYCPPNLYGESKVIGEKLVKGSDKKYDWAIIRPTSIWGPWFGPTYRSFFDLIRKGMYFNFSGHMCTKTYGYIGNTVYQIDSILHSKLSNGKTFYIGDYQATNIKEWSKEIATELDVKVLTIPFFLVYILAKCGDLFNKVGLKIPINSFRLANMTTDNVVSLSETRKIAPDLKYNRSEANKITINWIRSQLQ